MIRNIFVGLSALVGCAGVSSAAVPNAPAATSTATPAAARSDANEVVCERQEVIGSRLGTKRVCMTRSQWAEQRLIERQELTKVQVQRGTAGAH